jgi:hypothetical protein
VVLNAADFSRALLGRLDWDQAFEEQRVFVRSDRAAYLAGVLFPMFPIWRPPLDDLQRQSANPLY